MVYGVMCGVVCYVEWCVVRSRVVCGVEWCLKWCAVWSGVVCGVVYSVISKVSVE